MKKGTYRSGLLIGRFQPCHLGHIAAVRFALGRVSFLYLGVGSSDKSHELRNPFTAAERIRMLRAALEGEGIGCESWMPIPIPDASSHALWVSHVDMLVPEYEVVFSNDSLTRILFTEKGVKVLTTPPLERRTYSATEVRRRMVDGGNWGELVPKGVETVMREVDGVSRLKLLTEKKKITPMT